MPEGWPNAESPLAYMDAAVNDAVMSIAHLPHFVIKTTPPDDHSNEIAQIRQDITELDSEADDFIPTVEKKRAEIFRLRELDRTEAKPLKTEVKPDDKTVGEVWEISQYRRPTPMATRAERLRLATGAG